MTWTKLSDDFADDCDTLSDAAFRLHVEGLLWSNRKLLDCTLPKDRLAKFATCPDAVGELLSVGWWTDDGDHYVIRHHALYQRTREQVLKQQEVNQANGRKGGRSRVAGREQAISSETHSVSDSLSDSKSERDGTGRDRNGSGEEQPLTEVFGIGLSEDNHSLCVNCGEPTPSRNQFGEPRHRKCPTARQLTPA